MKLVKIIIGIIILFLLIHFLIGPFFAICTIKNPIYSVYPKPHKTLMGDTNETLIYPWGVGQPITVFVNLDNISIEDRKNYFQNIFDALQFWENDVSHNLSYAVKFKMVNNSTDANIIIKKKQIVRGDNRRIGTIHINSTGNFDPLGAEVCDTYNPPFTQCIINIRLDLRNENNLNTIKHEIGHALGLEHSFNILDFIKTNLEAPLMYDFEDSEIMFDYTIYDEFKKPFNILVKTFDLVFIVILLISIMIVYHQRNK